MSPLHSSISINFKIFFKPGHFKEKICKKLDILTCLKNNRSHANMQLYKRIWYGIGETVKYDMRKKVLFSFELLIWIDSFLKGRSPFKVNFVILLRETIELLSTNFLTDNNQSFLFISDYSFFEDNLVSCKIREIFRICFSRRWWKLVVSNSLYNHKFNSDKSLWPENHP